MDDYITRDEFDGALSSYVSWSELNEILNDITGGAGVRFEKVFTLPETGVPNVIYIVYSEGFGSNTCDEYIWDQEEYRFEQLGPKDVSDMIEGEVPSEDYVTQEQLQQALSEVPTLSIEKIYALPDYGEPNKIYLLQNEGSDGTNMYDEYFYDTDEARFEKIGSLVDTSGQE